MSAADISKLAVACARNGWTVGTGESCTGGLLASWIAGFPGISSCFTGSVVSYSAAVKVNVLGVPRSSIQVHGEVSLPVAMSMARGVKKALGCDWAVSITGIAGPSGGSVEKPVGTVCFAVVGPGVEVHSQQLFQSKLKGAAEMRQDIQRQAALFAFDFLLTAMR